MFKYSHKKQKDSLETRAVLLIFSFELEIFGVAVQRNRKNGDFSEELLSENNFEAVLTISVVMAMVPTLSREFRRSLQIKKIITNAPRVL